MYNRHPTYFPSSQSQSHICSWRAQLNMYTLSMVACHMPTLIPVFMIIKWTLAKWKEPSSEAIHMIQRHVLQQGYLFFQQDFIFAFTLIVSIAVASKSQNKQPPVLVTHKINTYLCWEHIVTAIWLQLDTGRGLMMVVGPGLVNADAQMPLMKQYMVTLLWMKTTICHLARL